MHLTNRGRHSRDSKLVASHPYRDDGMNDGSGGGNSPPATHERGRVLMIDMLREVQDYFRTTDPAKKSAAWHDLDRAALARICASRVAQLDEPENNPADEDNQDGDAMEHAVVQEILVGLVEKRLQTTRAQATQAPIDVQVLQQQFLTMARDSEQMQDELRGTKHDVKVLAFWALDELSRRSSVDHLKDTIRAQDIAMQAMQREIDALRQSTAEPHVERVRRWQQGDGEDGNGGAVAPTYEMQWNNVDLDMSIHELRNSVHATFRTNVDMLQDHIQSLERQLADAARHVADVTNLNHHLALEMSQVKDNDDATSPFVSTVSLLQTQVRDLDAALAASTRRASALEAELAVPSANLSYLSRQNALLQQRVDIYKKELDGQVESFRQRMADAALAHGPDCHNQFNGVCNDLIEALRSEIMTAREDHRREMIGLLDQMGQLVKDNYRLAAAATADGGDEAQMSADELNDSMPALSDDGGGGGLSMASLWQEKDQLERAARSLHADNNALVDQLHAYEATIATTDDQLEQLRHERTVQEEQVELLLQKINPMVAAHEALMAEKKAMADDLARREATIDALQATVFEMKREIKVITQDVDAIVEEKEMLLEELEELRKRQMMTAGEATGDATKTGDCANCAVLNQEMDQLHDAIEGLEAELRPMRRSLAMKDQSVQETKARVGELERRLAHDKSEYEKSVVERDHAIETLQKKVFEFKREVNVLTDDYDSIYEEKHELETKLDQVETQLVNLEDELAELDKVVAALREDVESWRMQFELATMRLEEERQWSHEFQEDACRHMARADALEAKSNELSLSQSALSAKRDEDVGKLKDVALSLKAKVDALTQSEALLTEHLTHAIADKTILEAESTTQKTELEALRRDMASLVQAHSVDKLSIEAALAALQTQHDSRGAHLDEKERAMAALEASVAELMASKAALAAQIDQLVGDKEAEIEGLSRSRGALEAEAAALKAEAASLKDTIAQVSAAKTESDAKALALTQELEANASHTLEVEVMLTKTQAQVVRLTEEQQMHGEGWQRSRDELEAKAAEVVADAALLKDMVAQLTQEKTTVQGEAETMARELEESHAHAVEVEAALAQSRDQSQALLARFKDKVAALTESEASLKHDVAALEQGKAVLEATMATLQSHLDALTGDHAALQAVSTRDKDALVALNDETTALRAHQAAIEAEFAASATTCDELAAAVAAKDEQVVAQATALAQLQATIDRLAASEASLQTKLALVSAANAALEQSVPDHVEKLASLSRSHSELTTASQSAQAEITRLKDMVATLMTEKTADAAAWTAKHAEWASEMAGVAFERDSAATKCSVLESAVSDKEDSLAKMQQLVERFKEKVATLTAQVAQHASAHEATKMELEAIVEAHVEEKKGMEDDLAAWVAKCATSVAQVEALTAENERGAQRMTELEAARDRRVAECVALEASRKLQEDHVADLTKKIQDLKETVTTQTTQHEATIVTWQTCHADLEAKFKAKSLELVRAVDDIAAWNEKFTSQVEALTAENDGHVRRIAELEAAQTRKDEHVDDLLEEVQALGTTVASMTTKTTADAAAMAALQASLAETTATLEAKTAEMAAALEAKTVALTDAVAQIASLEATVSQQEDQVAKLQALLDRFKEKLAALTKSEASLAAELVHVKDEKASLEMSVPDQVEKLSALGRANAELEQRAAAADADIARLVADAAALEAERAALATETRALQATVDAHAATHVDLEGAVAAKEAELAMLQALVARFKDKVAALTQSEAALTQQLVDMSAEKTAAEATLDQERDKVAAMTTVHSALEIAAMNLRADVARVESALAAKTSEHDAVAAAYERHVAECTRVATEMDAARAALAAQVQDLEVELGDNHTKRLELEAAVAYETDEKARLQTLLGRFKDKVTALTKSEEAMTRQVVQLTQEKTSLEMSVPEQVEAMASLTRSRGELEAQAKVLQEKNAELMAQVATLTQQQKHWTRERNDKEAALAGELASVVQARDSLAAQLDSTKTSCQHLEALLVAKEAQAASQDNLVAQLQAELTALAASDAALQTRLRSVQGEKEALEKRLPAHEEELASLSRSRSELALDSQALRGQNDQLRRDLDALALEVAARTNELATRDAELAARTNELSTRDAACADLQSAVDAAKAEAAQLAERHAAADAQWEASTKELQAKEEEISHLQELFEEEVATLKHDEEVANTRYEDLTSVHAELTDAHDDLVEKFGLLKLALDAAKAEVGETESQWQAKCADLSAKLLTLEDLLTKKDSVLVDLHATVAAADDRTMQLQRVLDEKMALIGQLEHLRASRPVVSPRQKDELSLPDDYALLVSENDQLRLGQDNLNTIVAVLKEQLAHVKEEHDALPWVGAFVHDVAPALGLDVAGAWRVEDIQATLRDVQDSIHALASTKASGPLLQPPRGAVMQVEELNSSATWLKAIEEADALNDKAEDLNTQVTKTRDLNGPMTSVSLFPDGIAKDVMSVVLEIVATFDDAASSSDLAGTLRAAWTARQRLLGQLVAAMHEVHPLSPSLMAREEQVDAWAAEMRGFVAVTSAQNTALSTAFMVMHRLIYPAHVANGDMDLASWAAYATTTEFADNLRQYTNRLEGLERDATAFRDIARPFLATVISTQQGDDDDGDERATKSNDDDDGDERLFVSTPDLVERWESDLRHVCAALSAMHSALTRDASTLTNDEPAAIASATDGWQWTDWVAYLRSTTFVESVASINADADSERLVTALDTLGRLVFSHATLAPLTANVGAWRAFADSNGFADGVQDAHERERQLLAENQAMCDALQNMHAVLWPPGSDAAPSMKPSMDSAEWAAYIHSQSFVDQLRQWSASHQVTRASSSDEANQSAVCDALHTMYTLLAAAGGRLDASSRSSMDLPRWTEYVSSDKFDANLRQYADRLDAIARESDVLCDELNALHHVIVAQTGDTTKRDLTQWHAYVQSNEFSDAMDAYARRQAQLQADSHDLHAKVLPYLTKLGQLSLTTLECPDGDDDDVSVDAVLAACQRQTVDKASVAQVVAIVDRLCRVCGIASQLSPTPDAAKLTQDARVRLCATSLLDVEDSLTKKDTKMLVPQAMTQVAVSHAEDSLTMATLVKMMQSETQTDDDDDDRLTNLRDILGRLEGHQEKYADLSRDDLATDAALLWPETLHAMELAKECQEAAIYVLETHNRSCVARTRAEIAMKCGVQRAFLRWKHKAAMHAVKESHGASVEQLKEAHDTTIVQLKEVHLNQLIKFRKQAIAERTKAAAEAKNDAIERVISFYARKEERSHLHHSFGKWRESRSDNHSVASDESRVTAHRMAKPSTAHVRARRESLTPMTTPVKSNPHERYGFGSTVARPILPATAAAKPGRTTMEKLLDGNAKLTARVSSKLPKSSP
ncbi:Aste57867_21066 [Aphanomyces stellatus]|uniref:Aste57867_21066 protein n=1 Tax=Aphanomyces stellatus TaxID=120398 RepID=A0A485LH61_9STRA|nr:hypothetical protein As57867_020998 [Aphanomyces stellatus]VFT97741.1 Aste57867_21066 [Aphanomyces stellatus]